jgi:capsule polysaccharide export protein KpsE/RkpR
VKAFHFRLEQALRWRAAQVTIEQARVATAAGRVAALKEQADTVKAELRNGGKQLTAGSTGSALEVWASYVVRARRRGAEIAQQTREAEKVLSATICSLTEANRKLLLLENLEESDLAEWRGEFNREMESFADEAFLIRLQSGRRTGA